MSSVLFDRNMPKSVKLVITQPRVARVVLWYVHIACAGGAIPWHVPEALP
jgi:hypothetical protein